MNLHLVREIDRRLGVPLCKLSSGFKNWIAPRSSDHPPKRILILLLSEMGSLVLARPLFERLKQRYPQAEIHVLLFESNRPALELLDLVPDLHIHGLPNSSIFTLIKQLPGRVQALRKLRFDISIDCELFSRISSLLALYSGASKRIGFHPHTQEGLYRGSFITHPVLYNPYLHISAQFLNLAEAIDSKAYPRVKKSPDIPTLNWKKKLNPETLDHLKKRLLMQFPSLLDSPLVLIYPSGGALPIRAWPESNYQKLMQVLLQKHDCHIGVIGLPSDRPQAERLCQQSGIENKSFNLAGFTQTPEELVYLLSLATLLLTNDGGPAHFATLADLPTIVLFGPETPELYRPLNDKSLCLYQSLPCSPCLTAYNHRNSPCDGDNQCLKQIHIDTVLNEVERLLVPSEYA